MFYLPAAVDVFAQSATLDSSQCGGSTFNMASYFSIPGWSPESGMFNFLCCRRRFCQPLYGKGGLFTPFGTRQTTNVGVARASSQDFYPQSDEGAVVQAVLL